MKVSAAHCESTSKTAWAALNNQHYNIAQSIFAVLYHQDKTDINIATGYASALYLNGKARESFKVMQNLFRCENVTTRNVNTQAFTAAKLLIKRLQKVRCLSKGQNYFMQASLSFIVSDFCTAKSAAHKARHFGYTDRSIRLLESMIII